LDQIAKCIKVNRRLGKIFIIQEDVEEEDSEDGAYPA